MMPRILSCGLAASAVTLASLLAVPLVYLIVFAFRMIALEQRIRHSHTSGIGASSFGFQVNSLWILAFAGAIFGITFFAFWRRSSRNKTTSK